MKKVKGQLDESKQAIDDKSRERESSMHELQEASAKRQRLYTQAISTLDRLNRQIMNASHPPTAPMSE